MTVRLVHPWYLKPEPWNVSVGAIEPGWEWFWDGLVVGVPLWEGGGAPHFYGRHGWPLHTSPDHSGTWVHSAAGRIFAFSDGTSNRISLGLGSLIDNLDRGTLFTILSGSNIGSDNQIRGVYGWSDGISSHRALWLRNDDASGVADGTPQFIITRTATGVTQVGAPTSDVSAGSWTTAPLWSKVDEASPGDDSTITSDAVGNNADSTTAEVALSSVNDPGVSTGHVLRVRWNCSSTSSLSAIAELVQNTTVIATLTVEGISSTETESTHTLTGTEADSITDYSDLRIRLRCRGTGGGAARSLVVEMARLEVPEPAAASLSIVGASGALAADMHNLAVQWDADGANADQRMWYGKFGRRELYEATYLVQQVGSGATPDDSAAAKYLGNLRNSTALEFNAAIQGFYLWDTHPGEQALRQLAQDPWGPWRMDSGGTAVVVAAPVEVLATTAVLSLATLAATVRLDVEVAAATGSLALTEHAAAVALDVTVGASTAALTLGTLAATVAADTSVQASTAALTLTTFAASLSADTNVAASTAALTLTEQAASVAVDVGVAAVTDTLTLTTHAATVEVGSNVEVAASTAALALATHAASIAAATNVATNVATLTLAGQQATVNAAVDVQAASLALTLATFQAGVSLGVDVDTALAALTLTEHAAAVAYDVDVRAALNTLTLATYGATVTAIVPVDVSAPFTATWTNPARTALLSDPARTASWTNPNRTAEWS